MRAGEAWRFYDVAAGTVEMPDALHSNATAGPVQLTGGLYQLNAIATWGAVYVNPTSGPANPINSITANGSWQAYLPPGQYRLVFVTGSAGYFVLTRIAVGG